MKLWKKTISLILTFTIIASAIITSGIISVFAKEDTSKEKEYIVLTDSDLALESALKLSSDSEILLDTDSGDTVVSKLLLSSAEVNQLKQTDGVVAVEKDITLTGSTSETDEVDVIDYLFKDVDTDNLNLWYLDAVGNDDVNGKNKVKIELLDSGVNLNSDIAVKERINLIDGDDVNPLYEDFSGHGTSMASVIAAKDNGVGVTGINPNAKLYSVRVLDDNIQAPLSRVVEGIQWGIDNNMDIINMSFGTNTNSAILREVIQKADEAGILLVSATGNDPDSGVQYPAAYPEVLAVGSMNENSEISDFTSVGNEMDVVAPGEKIETAGIFGTINGTSGTSISTAEVSAVASKILEKDNSKSPDFVKGLILASAKKIQDSDVTTGAVDGNYALKIYDEYEKSYIPNKNIQEYVNPNDCTSYDTDGFVTGLWRSAQHAELADLAYSGLVGAKKLALITASAKAADKEITGGNTNASVTLRDTSALHGAGNYVANFRSAWKFVCELKKSDSTIKKATTAMLNSINDLLNTSSESDILKLDQLADSFSTLNKINMSKVYTSVTDDMDIDATRCKATGLCIHMIGDTFAHRTMVPDTYDADKFNKIDPKTNKNFFYTTEDTSNLNFKTDKALRRNLVHDVQNNDIRKTFRNKKSLLKAVEYGVVECRDIRRFCPAYKNGAEGADKTVNSYYEDNTSFYGKRYTESQNACEYLFDEISENGYSKMDKLGDVYVLMFIPAANNYKMSSLKKYITAIGTDTSFMTSKEWSSCSSSSLSDSQIDALE